MDKDPKTSNTGSSNQDPSKINLQQKIKNNIRNAAAKNKTESIKEMEQAREEKKSKEKNFKFKFDNKKNQTKFNSAVSRNRTNAIRKIEEEREKKFKNTFFKNSSKNNKLSEENVKKINEEMVKKMLISNYPFPLIAYLYGNLFKNKPIKNFNEFLEQWEIYIKKYGDKKISLSTVLNIPTKGNISLNNKKINKNKNLNNPLTDQLTLLQDEINKLKEKINSLEKEKNKIELSPNSNQKDGRVKKIKYKIKKLKNKLSLLLTQKKEETKKALSSISSSGKKGLSSLRSLGKKGLSSLRSSGKKGLSSLRSSGKKGLSVLKSSGKKGLSVLGSSGKKGLSVLGSSGKKGLSVLRSSGKKAMNSMKKRFSKKEYKNLLLLREKNNKNYKEYNHLYDNKLKDINSIINNKFQSIYKEKIKRGLSALKSTGKTFNYIRKSARNKYKSIRRNIKTRYNKSSYIELLKLRNNIQNSINTYNLSFDKGLYKLNLIKRNDFKSIKDKMSKFVDNKVSKLPKLPILPTLPTLHEKSDMVKEYKNLSGTENHKRGEQEEQSVSIIAKEKEGEDPRLNNLRKRNPAPNNSVTKSTNLFSLNNEQAEEKNKNDLNAQSKAQSKQNIIHTENNPYPNGGINEYKDYQVTPLTNGDLGSNQVVPTAQPKNNLPQGNTNQQIRALQEQVEEQENKNNQQIRELKQQANKENAETPEQQLDKLLQSKSNETDLPLNRESLPGLFNQGSQTSQKGSRRIRNERNELSNQILANQGIQTTSRMGAIEEMERQRQERIKASRKNKNQFKFNKPENQETYNQALDKLQSIRGQYRNFKPGELQDLYREYPLNSNENDPLNGRTLNNAQQLLSGTTSQPLVMGGKNKRKYNKRKLKTKIDKIPKKYILKL